MQHHIAKDYAGFSNTPSIPVEQTIDKLVFSLSERELLHLTNLINLRLNSTQSNMKADEAVNKPSVTDRISARENEVLTLVASGYTRPEVAAALNISPNTAATHIATIYRKLDINSIAEATAYAVRHGLIY